MSKAKPNIGWHRADIIAAIHKKNSTLLALGKANGLGSSTCRASLMKPSPRANRIIADFIGVPVHQLWPLWFDQQGNRLIREKPSRPVDPHTSQKREPLADMGEAA